MITDITTAPSTLGGVRLKTQTVAGLEYINASHFRDELQQLEGMEFNGAHNEAKYLLENSKDVEMIAKWENLDPRDLYLYDGEDVWMTPALFISYATYQSTRILFDCYKAYYEMNGIYGNDDED